MPPQTPPITRASHGCPLSVVVTRRDPAPPLPVLARDAPARLPALDALDRFEVPDLVGGVEEVRVAILATVPRKAAVPADLGGSGGLIAGERCLRPRGPPG
ncbi:hypothetical protein GCM10012320_28680 [Sinomonas cellulolyticus]|nr:hypothetical protein GCM10012320_28680 [Sinomonas sp. KCTC 49339]